MLSTYFYLHYGRFDITFTCCYLLFNVKCTRIEDFSNIHNKIEFDVNK